VDTHNYDVLILANLGENESGFGPLTIEETSGIILLGPGVANRTGLNAFVIYQAFIIFPDLRIVVYTVVDLQPNTFA
jgi:hypothetical protein